MSCYCSVPCSSSGRFEPDLVGTGHRIRGVEFHSGFVGGSRITNPQVVHCREIRCSVTTRTSRTSSGIRRPHTNACRNRAPTGTHYRGAFRSKRNLPVPGADNAAGELAGDSLQTTRYSTAKRMYDSRRFVNTSYDPSPRGLGGSSSSKDHPAIFGDVGRSFPDCSK